MNADERRCAYCEGLMPEGKSRRAKFCKRECQVASLHDFGPTYASPDPMKAPKLLSLALSDEDRERLEKLAVKIGFSTRRTGYLILHDQLEILIRDKP